MFDKRPDLARREGGREREREGDRERDSENHDLKRTVATCTTGYHQ